MGREAFRFVHAADLRLDEPLEGVGPLSQEQRRLAEDATLIAWERTVACCLDAQVDFLLLTGNAFNAATDSLRARKALSSGFETLADHRISAYVIPGRLDPASAWNRGTPLPENVTLIPDDQAAPVTISCNGQTLATLSVAASLQLDDVGWSGPRPVSPGRPRGPFTIGVVPAGTTLEWDDGTSAPPHGPASNRAAEALVPAAIDGGVDYLALGNGRSTTRPLQTGVAHSPGPTQAIDRNEAGYCGCSLVHVSENGPADITPVQTAPVRFEAIHLDFAGAVDWDTLIERMADAWFDLDVDAAVNLWLVDWHLTGAASIFDELSDPTVQGDLWELLDAELDEADSAQRRHRLLLHHWSARQDFAEELLETLERVIAEEGVFLVEQLRRESQTLQELAGNYAQPLIKTVRSLSRRELVSGSRELLLAQLHQPAAATARRPRVLLPDRESV